MDRKAAKELVHIQGWLDRVDEIVERGKGAYLTDDLLQEASRATAGQWHEAARRRQSGSPWCEDPDRPGES